MKIKKGFIPILCFLVSSFLISCTGKNDNWVSGALQNNSHKNSEGFNAETAGGATGTQPWQNGSAVPCSGRPTSKESCFY